MIIQLTEEQIHDLRRHFQAVYDSLVNSIIRPLIRIWPILKSIVAKLMRFAKKMKIYAVRPHKRSAKYHCDACDFTMTTKIPRAIALSIVDAECLPPDHC